MGQSQPTLAEQAKYFKLLKVPAPALSEMKKKGPAFSGFQLRKDFETGKAEGAVLRLHEVDSCNIQISDKVSLQDADNKIIAVLQVQDKWIGYIPEALQKFGTSDEADERVKALKAEGQVYIGGPITWL
jgi:ATP sulfurylase